MNIIDRQLVEQLEIMQRDYLNSPTVYHASKFWEKLNKLNIQWLEKDGLDNFKRSVNNNYFNWAVKFYSPYFLNMLGIFLQKNLLKLRRFLILLFVSIPQMHYRTSIANEIKANFFDKKVYAAYLFLLYEYVSGVDKFGLFKLLEEPSVGNPITAKIDSKIVSQDICNSYLEYFYIRSILGDKFKNISRIVEIGSGYGRLGYVFNRLHSSEIKYIFIDIPPALHIAQWYFDQVAPDLHKFKYREFKVFSDIEKEFEESSMCFLLPHQLGLLPDKSIDLIINISSLHEMSISQIKHYYKLINAKGLYFYTKQWLFWVNPEDNISVSEASYPTDPQWVLLNTRINPVHKKFFEAIFEI
jgi:putative sugar O-methyltransferase